MFLSVNRSLPVEKNGGVLREMGRRLPFVSYSCYSSYSVIPV